MDFSGSHILLTGATGLIGGQWLPLLLAADPRRLVTVLARDRTRVPNHPKIRLLDGDLSAPRLGLANSEWNSLCGSITAIIHCAADTRFNLPLDQARRVDDLRRIAVLRTFGPGA